MNIIWLHRYSVLSLLMAATELLINFGATSQAFPGLPVARGSVLFKGLLTTSLVFGLLSFLAAGLAVGKEASKRLPIGAVVFSVCAFYVAGLRVAV